MQNENYNGDEDTPRFQNFYRISSTRANWHDYMGGAYFITICTENRKYYFGEILSPESVMHREFMEPQMKLSAIGNLLKEQIIQTPQIRKDMNVEIPLFAIMPNHVHLIVIIGNNSFNSAAFEMKSEQFGPQRKNVGSIVRGIKSSTTCFARINHIPFAWQRLYYDRIIRNQFEMNSIAQYVENNVLNWYLDKYYVPDDQ